MIIEAREDTITLRGDVKSNIWAAIQAAAALLLENHPAGIIVDCSGVNAVTPKGAETFTDAFAYISAHNAKIVVAALRPELLEVGKTVPGMRSQIPVAATVEEARASIDLEEITLKRGKAEVAAVVPMVGNWARATYYARKFAVGENCEIHLVDLLKVPRTLPIGTPLPDEENEAKARLDAARKLVEDSGFKSFTHVEKVRSESAGLLDFLARLKADFTVLSIDKGDRNDPFMEESEAMSVLAAAGCEVSLIKGAPSVKAEPALKHIVVPAVGSWEHALEHACKIASSRETTVVSLVYLLTIPRAEPIDVPKPDEEARIGDYFSEAVRIGRKFGVAVNPDVERVRDPVLGLMKMLESDDFDLAIVGVENETAGDYHIARAIAIALMQEQPCETMFLRVVPE